MNRTQNAVSNIGVKRWKAILSLVCLSLWLPATHHCQLEKLPGLAFLECTGDSSEKSNCEGDSCDAVEKGLYKSSDNHAVLAVLAAVFVVQAPVSLTPEPAAPFTYEIALISSPPRHRCESWEWYSSRALAIRGPSFLS